MERRVYITKSEHFMTEEAQDAVKVEALANNCPEIAWGIPPVLKDIVTNEMLPHVYEEPVAEPPKPPRDLAAEIDELKAMIEKLEKPKEL